MHAVAEIQLQTRLVLLFVHFENVGRTKMLAGISVLHLTTVVTDIKVQNFQMAGLILFVIGVGETDIGQPVEAEHAVGLRIVDLRALVGRLERRVIRPVMRQRPGRAAAQDDGVERGIGDRREQPPFEGGPHVADLVELVPHPALAHRVLISRDLARGLVPARRSGETDPAVRDVADRGPAAAPHLRLAPLRSLRVPDRAVGRAGRRQC